MVSSLNWNENGQRRWVWYLLDLEAVTEFRSALRQNCNDIGRFSVCLVCGCVSDGKLWHRRVTTCSFASQEQLLFSWILMSDGLLIYMTTVWKMDFGLMNNCVRYTATWCLQWNFFLQLSREHIILVNVWEKSITIHEDKNWDWLQSCSDVKRSFFVSHLWMWCYLIANCACDHTNTCSLGSQ